MNYQGNHCESHAKAYKVRQYTHSETLHGREVKYFDCWSDQQDPPPAFGESLSAQKVREVDNALRIQAEFWGEIPE